MRPVIEIDNISKRFLIGANTTSYRTLRESLSSPAFLHKRREFWALRDISFRVERGEKLGIIGNNGAGKTTLLKILSRITKPTSGRGRVDGRVASLLEVGTGFHPELTGRENIYLNGVILGLKKHEIDRNFESIVEFAGVSEFLNTAIKYYSMGMWARLAFSVAAHLEPEILLIDEVLSVGDAEFQKKSLDKMNDLSGSGRTVLFVSHNLAAVRQLCNRCILLNEGKIVKTGEVNDVVDTYMSFTNRENSGSASLADHTPRKGNRKARLLLAELKNPNGDTKATFLMRDDMEIHLWFEAREFLKTVRAVVEITNSYGDKICVMHDSDSGFRLGNVEGTRHISLSLTDIRFYPGRYFISVLLLSEIMNFKYDTYDEIESAISFDVENQLISDRILNRQEGLILMTPEWNLHQQ